MFIRKDQGRAQIRICEVQVFNLDLEHVVAIFRMVLQEFCLKEFKIMLKHLKSTISNKFRLLMESKSKGVPETILRSIPL